MKVALFQFSGTGNTWFVAKHLQEALERLGTVCSLYAIERLSELDLGTILEEADMVGLGYPIYGSDFPRPVSEWIETLPHVHNKRAFVFCTQMMYSGDGAAIGAKALRKKGFTVRQLMHVNMPNNITDYRIVRWVKPTPSGRLRRRVKRKTNGFVHSVMQDKRQRKGEGLGSLFLGLLQRVPTGGLKESSRSALKIDDTCIGCGRCVELCPTSTLSFADGRVHVGKECCFCYRCVNHCPVKAMRFSKRSKVKRPYLGPSPEFDIEEVRKHRLKE